MISNHILTDTINKQDRDPFVFASADSLAVMLTRSVAADAGDGAMWLGKATMLSTGLMQSLVWLRDTKGLSLETTSVASSLQLETLMDLAAGRHDPDLPNSKRKSIQNYLCALPCYDPKASKQPQCTIGTHGYLEMMLAQSLLRMFNERSWPMPKDIGLSDFRD